MIVAIVDYGSGNLRSAAKAFERAAAENAIGAEIVVTSVPEIVAGADRVVLPGVGAFADCRRGLAAVPGLEAAMREAVCARGRPFLGICVGMQLMADRGREFEITEGLGWIGGEVVALEPNDPVLKISHIGWNELIQHRVHPLLNKETVLFEEHTADLARNVEKVLRKHGKEIAEMQYTQKRVAELAMDLYCVAACLSRTSRAIERRGEEGARREIDLTTMFVSSAEGRMASIVRGFDKNDDELRKSVAGRAYTDGSYPFDIVLESGHTAPRLPIPRFALRECGDRASLDA